MTQDEKPKLLAKVFSKIASHISKDTSGFLSLAAVLVIGIFLIWFVVREVQKDLKIRDECDNRCGIFRVLVAHDRCFCLTEKGYQEAR